MHRATVKRIEAYGVFVALAGFRRHGLVHTSQVGRGGSGAEGFVLALRCWWGCAGMMRACAHSPHGLRSIYHAAHRIPQTATPHPATNK